MRGKVAVIELGVRATREQHKANIEYTTSFPDGLRFRCIPGCGLCCRSYRIPLTLDDLRRLRTATPPEDCATIELAPERGNRAIVGFMENERNGGCCYLDSDSRCTVYDNRPLYCRTYPLIRDSYAEHEISVDYTCPGVGAGEALTRQQIEEPLRLEAEARPGCLELGASRAAYDTVCGALKAKGVYADAGLMRAVSAAFLEQGLEMQSATESLIFLCAVAAAIATALSGGGNLHGEESAAQLIATVERLMSFDSSVPFEHSASVFPDGEKLRICLGEGVLPRELLIFENGRFLIYGTGGVLGELDARPAQESRLSETAAELLGGYLKEWIGRQSLLRFVHSTALARPGRVQIMQLFFELLLHALCRTITTAEALRKYGNHETITAPLVREAIRANDGPLRRRCASAVSKQE